MTFSQWVKIWVAYLCDWNVSGIFAWLKREWYFHWIEIWMVFLCLRNTKYNFRWINECSDCKLWVDSMRNLVQTWITPFYLKGIRWSNKLQPKAQVLDFKKKVFGLMFFGCLHTPGSCSHNCGRYPSTSSLLGFESKQKGPSSRLDSLHIVASPWPQCTGRFWY